MSRIEHECDTARIDDYLSDQLGADEVTDMERHLSECERCQIEIQRLAADPDIWRDAVDFLSDGAGSSSDSDSQQRNLGLKAVLDALAPSDDPEMLGRIGDYEVTGVVGLGGMGAVLKGFDRALRRVVAIKVMAPHLADSGPARSRFQREARAAASVTHDNVIDTYGVAEANGLPYLVMPYARGPSLQTRIDESGPLSTIEVVRIGRQIASGLAAAHEQGLVHRDIKPANILLNDGVERLWISDFGVARAMDDASMTRTGLIAGTPQYMSPEQARGEFVDQRSDLFSMGSVLYTACTGRPPFRSEAAYGILRRITDTHPRPIRELNPEIPEWLCCLIDRLMEKEPAERYQDASEVAESLDQCLAHLQQPQQIALPMDLVSPGKQRKNEHRGGRRFPNRLVLGGILGLLVLLFAAAKWTEPAKIAGAWQGKQWTVNLTSVPEARGWYSGTVEGVEGDRGAIRLEWSRIRRRYTGRWKVGERAGSVTLRLAKNRLRGAVSTDLEADGSSPGLREVNWDRVGEAPSAENPGGASQRANQRANERANETPKEPKRAASLIEVLSPASGRVIRWHVKVGDRVKRGDPIAHLDSKSVELSRLESISLLMQSHIESSQDRVSGQENTCEATKARRALLETQYKVYRQVQEQLNAASDAKVKAAASELEIAEASLEEVAAATAFFSQNHERTKKLAEKNLITKSELQASERKLREHLAKVRKAEATVEAAKNEIAIRRNEENAKRIRAQSDMAEAEAELTKATLQETKAIAELEKARKDLQEAQKKSQEVIGNINAIRSDPVGITAPASGTIVALIKASLFRPGDIVATIRTTSAEGNAPDAPEQPPREARPDAVGSVNNRPIGWGELGLNLPGMADIKAVRTVIDGVDLTRKIRWLRAQQVHSKEGQGEQEAAKLKQELAIAQRQRATFVDLLEAQLRTARALHQEHVDAMAIVQAQVESGDMSPMELEAAANERKAAEFDVREWELLTSYFADSEGDSADPLISTRKVIIDILANQKEAADAALQYAVRTREVVRRQAEMGDMSFHERFAANVQHSFASSESAKLTALLKHLSQLQGDETPSAEKKPKAAPKDADSKKK